MSKLRLAARGKAMMSFAKNKNSEENTEKNKSDMSRSYRCSIMTKHLNYDDDIEERVPICKKDESFLSLGQLRL